ncbi:hypothetical protein PanWU01x14_030500 [Parasponia andersonii]|uniref:Uncharacterized protein n=1 Tax=Parasponia andersonii TaxID=3476 RepID=A0A2P5DUS1_PARAD|nr:hypothetical protein PanWU01x14_030500 [Parasponia andersonii]
MAMAWSLDYGDSDGGTNVLSNRRKTPASIMPTLVTQDQSEISFLAFLPQINADMTLEALILKDLLSQ